MRMSEGKSHSNTNPKVDAFIFSGESLAIDEGFARQELSKYLNDVSLLSSGVPYAELGISERRAALRPTLVSLSQDGIEVGQMDDASLRSRGEVFAHLKLGGVMQMEGGISNPGIGALVSQVRAANADPDVSGILLETNSGGGEGQAGVALMNAIKDSTKPVVALVNQAGSAAMWAVSSADMRIANGALAKAGSIGVYSSINKKFAEEYKANYQDIYSEHSPNKNSAFRQLLEGSEDGIKATVDRAAVIFRNDIKDNLSLKGDAKEVEDTLSGGYFEAETAKAKGLIDEIGTFESAVRALAGLSRDARTASMAATSSDMGLMDDLRALIAKNDKTMENEGKATKQAGEKATDQFSEVLAAIADLSGKVDGIKADFAAEIEKVKADSAKAVADVKAENEVLQESLAELEGKLTDQAEQVKAVENEVLEAKGKPTIRKRVDNVADASETEKLFAKGVRKRRKAEYFSETEE